MVNPPEFATYQEMENSLWLANTQHMMLDDMWPVECLRCEQVEKLGDSSVREHELMSHKVKHKLLLDYLNVSGVLDNICNSACISCSSQFSTKIGSLEGKDYIVINNIEAYKSIPQDRIVNLELTGGEPSASPAYRELLDNVPPNLKLMRINTNGMLYMKSLEKFLAKDVRVTLTLSLDGVGKVYEYTRWPSQWDKFCQVIEQYKELADKNSNLTLNFWATLSALNINNFPDIHEFADKVNIPVSYGILNAPDAINIKYSNKFTQQAKANPKLEKFHSAMAVDKDNTAELDAYIAKQDALRNINIKDYL